MSFRDFIFAKNATNSFGHFKKGDRAQGGFPKKLIDSYVRHGILVQVEEPAELSEPIKEYAQS